jgi:hypothetical protein
LHRKLDDEPGETLPIIGENDDKLGADGTDGAVFHSPGRQCKLNVKKSPNGLVSRPVSMFGRERPISQIKAEGAWIQGVLRFRSVVV